jgi:hypothetical protein
LRERERYVHPRWLQPHQGKPRCAVPPPSSARSTSHVGLVLDFTPTQHVFATSFAPSVACLLLPSNALSQLLVPRLPLFAAASLTRQELARVAIGCSSCPPAVCPPLQPTPSQLSFTHNTKAHSPTFPRPSVRPSLSLCLPSVDGCSSPYKLGDARPTGPPQSPARSSYGYTEQSRSPTRTYEYTEHVRTTTSQNHVCSPITPTPHITARSTRCTSQRSRAAERTADKQRTRRLVCWLVRGQSSMLIRWTVHNHRTC